MFKPGKTYVAVELIEKAKVTESGIILKSADPSEANKGRVIEIGKDVTMVNVGDIILPNWNANKGKVNISENEYWIIPESEIVGVFDN